MLKNRRSYAGRGLAAAAAASLLVLAGCSSLPVSEVPIVDRSVNTEGAPVSTGATVVGSLRDSGRVHTVTVGDTIYNISVRYGVRPAELMQLNAVTDPTQLSIGRELHIPVSTTEPRELSMPAGVRVNRVENVAPIEEATVMKTSGGSAETPVIVDRTSEAETAAAAKAEEAAKPAAKTADKPAAVVPGTRMLWPARGPVLSNYAQNGKGLDIGGTVGSVVVAAGDGQVLFVGSGVAGYGQLVIVKHSPTLVTAYGHNSKIVVKLGDSVKAGQKIAELGNTDADQPKLRFEVRDKGKPVDPMKYLPPQRN